MFVRSLLISACAFTSATPTFALSADLAFAKVGSQIVSFPVGDPTNATPIGPPLADSFSGMDFDPAANVLWAIDFTAQTVGTVNQATGAYTSSAMLQGACCITAFTIDPVGGTFYVAKGDQYLYILDPASGETTLIAAGAAPATQITALAADCSGRLFALAGNGTDLPNLYQADLNGDPVLIGTPGYAGPTNLEFDNRSGVLYAWFLPPGGGNTVSTHVTLDASTGQATPIVQLDGRYRMAIRNECSIFADGFEA
jgi:hypothetical protein